MRFKMIIISFVVSITTGCATEVPRVIPPETMAVISCEAAHVSLQVASVRVEGEAVDGSE